MSTKKITITTVEDLDKRFVHGDRTEIPGIYDWSDTENRCVYTFTAQRFPGVIRLSMPRIAGGTNEHDAISYNEVHYLLSVE